jgi:outer membrane protein assembly factor BamB
MRRQRGSADPRLVEVELVEAPDALAELAAEADRRSGRVAPAPDPRPRAATVVAPSRRGPGPRLRTLGVMVLAVLVVAAIGANRVLSQREAARQIDLAAHPWILPRLDGPLSQVWQVEGPGLVAEDEGVVVLGDPLGSGVLRALDTATGEVLWSRERPGEVCRGTQEGPDEIGPPSEAANLTPDYLLCMPLGHYMRDHRPPAPDLVTTITVLHPTLGDELSQLEVAGTPLTWEVVGGDLLVTFVTHDAAVGIGRWDVGAREQVWAFESEPGVMPQGLFGEWQHVVHDGVVQVTTEQVAFAISVETGEQVPPEGAVFDPERVRATLPDGALVEWIDDRSLGVGRVLGPDGSPRFEFDGVPWFARRSDGSVPEILVIQRPGSGGLAGLDAVTGEQRWSLATAQRPTPLLQIEGVMIATAGETATAIDLNRGTRLWETPVATTAGPAAVTDGEVVILAVQEGWESSLVALQLRSGLELWRSAVRPGVRELHATPDGTVLLLSPGGITAYR